jgi:hypothetical protein
MLTLAVLLGLGLIVFMCAGCVTSETIRAIEASRDLAEKTIAAVNAEAELVEAAVKGTAEEVAAAREKAEAALAAASEAKIEASEATALAAKAEEERADAVAAEYANLKESVKEGDWFGGTNSLLAMLLLLTGGTEARKYLRDKKVANGGSK